MADVEAGRSMMNQRVVLTKSDIPGAKILRETVKECSIFQVFSDKHPQPPHKNCRFSEFVEVWALHFVC